MGGGCIRKDDGNLKDIDWLAWEKWAVCGYWLRLVEVLDIVIQQIL
jgi:hypothetical protein